ncbi:DUF5659 domain-containing protein [Lysinibacillus agricola]|uniref:DUF5659 domain-containing protein n=1 Tax=Lysinibacillus agricola TaxID=2590012 RepID=UPI003C18780C
MQGNKYQTIFNKNLACALSYVTGQRFYTFDSFEDANKKVYSFERTDELDRAMTQIQQLKKSN